MIPTILQVFAVLSILGHGEAEQANHDKEVRVLDPKY
jgi:hypothetical protein